MANESTVKVRQTEEVPKGKWLLYYWTKDTPGRAEFVKLMFEELGVEYELTTEHCTEYFRQNGACRVGKVGFPCYAPPMIQIGDMQLSQVGVICRYIGKKYGLWPTNEMDEWHAEQVNCSIHDFIAEGRLAFHGKEHMASYYIQKEETKPYIEKFTKDRFPYWLTHFEAILKHNKGGQGFLIGDSLTYVDLAMFHILRATEAQFPEEWKKASTSYATLLAQFKDRIAKRPKIAAYLASDRCKPFEGNSMM